MARFARVVIAGLPYHLTHRGNHRSDVFFSNEDREIYLAMVGQACSRHGLSVWGWCAMTNHVHFLAVPRESTSLALGIGKPHMRYSRRINSERGWTGHLWANRFYSTVLDDEHLWHAIRSIEQNPVRAGLVARCEDWPWSSARAHCGMLEDGDVLLGRDDPFPSPIAEWSSWINDELDEEIAQRLRRNTLTGRPTGNVDFVRNLEALLSRDLSAPKRGRPRKCDELDVTEDLLG